MCEYIHGEGLVRYFLRFAKEHPLHAAYIAGMCGGWLAFAITIIAGWHISREMIEVNGKLADRLEAMNTTQAVIINELQHLDK